MTDSLKRKERNRKYYEKTKKYREIVKNNDALLTSTNEIEPPKDEIIIEPPKEINKIDLLSIENEEEINNYIEMLVEKRMKEKKNIPAIENKNDDSNTNFFFRQIMNPNVVIPIIGGVWTIATKLMNLKQCNTSPHQSSNTPIQLQTDCINSINHVIF